MPLKLSDDLKALVRGANFAHLATLMPDGSPQVAPVWVDLDGEFILVRREEYSVHNVELQLAWLPAAFPLRKECYTLVRDEEGVVSLRVADTATRCRLSSVSASTGIAVR